MQGPTVNTWIYDDCHFKGNVTLPQLRYWNGMEVDGKADLTLTYTSQVNTGGNVFKDSTKITSAGPTDLYMGHTDPDTLLGPFEFNLTGGRHVYMCYNSAGNYFADNVILNNFSGSTTDYLYFGHLSAATAHVVGDITLNVDSTSGDINFRDGITTHDGELLIGSTGYHSGRLYLEGYRQSGVQDVDLTVMDNTSQLYLGPGLILGGDVQGPTVNTWIYDDCHFKGNVTLPQLRSWTGSTFDKKTTVTTTYTGQLVTGGHVFKDSLIINHLGPSHLYLGNITPDTLYGPLVYNLEKAGVVYLSYNCTGNYYGGNIILNNHSGNTNYGFIIGNSTSAGGRFLGDIIMNVDSTSGYIKFHRGSNIHEGLLKVGTEGYHSGLLTLDAYQQTGVGTIDLSATDHNSKLSVLSNADITADFIYAGPGNITLTSAVFRGDAFIEGASLAVTNSEFFGTTSLNKTGTVNNLCYGNKFHGVTTIENSSTTNYQYWGYNTPDTFLNKLTLINTATSQTLWLGYTSASVYEGDIVLKGDTGNVIQLGASGVNYKTVLNGNAFQTISIQNEIDDEIYRLVIDKPGGQVSIKDTVTIRSALTLTDGIIGLEESDVLVLPDGVTVTGGSDTSYVDGAIVKEGNDAFTFPLGKAGNYRPITMTAPGSTTDSYAVSYDHRNPNRIIGDGFGNGSLQYLTPIDYWQVEQNNGTNNVSWTIGWEPEDGYNNFTTSDLRVAGWDGSGWDDLGAVSVTGDTASGTMTTSAAVELDTISYLALGSISSNMLPRGIDATVTALVEPTDTTFGVLSIEPTYGIGEATVIVNNSNFLTRDSISSYWGASNIVDTVYSWFGDSIALTDTLIDVWSGQVQNWIEPGLYDIKLVDSSQDTVTKELAFPSTMEFSSVDHLSYSNDTIVKDTVDGNWHYGHGSLAHLLSEGQTGAFSFEVIDTTGLFAVGFRSGIVSDTGGYELMDFAVVFDSTDIHIWNGTQLTENVSNVAYGDSIRLDRLSSEYRVYRNSQKVHSLDGGQPLGKFGHFPTISIHTGKRPFSRPIPYIRPYRPEYIVNHNACGNPNSGSITVDLGGVPLSNWPNYTINWTRLDGPDPEHGPDDLTISNLESGTYQYSFSYNTGSYSAQLAPVTFTIDNWVDWTNMEQVVNDPNDASIIRDDPFNPGGLPLGIFAASSHAGANSEQLLHGSSVDVGRVNFSFPETANWSAMGFSRESVAQQSHGGSIEYGVVSLHLDGTSGPVGNWLFDNSGTQVQMISPKDMEHALIWEDAGSSETIRLRWEVPWYITTSGGSIAVDLAPSVEYYSVDANVPLSLTGYLDVHTNFECQTISFDDNDPCALMKKTLDGGYHWTVDGKLRFQIDEEYVDGNGTIELSYRVLDDNNEEVVSSIGTSPINDDFKYYGDNRYQLNLNNVIDPGMYVLEVTSEKNEKFYLRFKKGV